MNGYRAWVGSSVGTMTPTVQRFLDAAYAASGKASDLGGVVFSQHTGYGPAMRANRAAQKAWHLLIGAARNDGEPDLAQDGQDRVEELQVAMEALRKDFMANASIANVHFNKASPAQPGNYNPGSFPSGRGGTAAGAAPARKWWLWGAAIAAGAAKLLHFW